MVATNRDPVSFPIVCNKNPNMVFNLAEPKDKEELTEFVMNQYFHRFPLKDVEGFDVEKEVRPWIDKYITSMCSKNYSIILRDAGYGNRIAAAAVNNIVPKIRAHDYIGIDSFTDPIQRPGWQKIINLIDELHRGIDWGQDSVISLDLMTVGENYTNRGISLQCLDLTVKVAKSRGVRTVKLEAMNEFMAKTSLKAGFRMAKEIKYDDTDLKLPKTTTMLHEKIRLFIHKF